jgi:hypothetical protein
VSPRPAVHVSLALALMACARGSSDERTDTLTATAIPPADTTPVTVTPTPAQTPPATPPAGSSESPRGGAPSMRPNPGQGAAAPPAPPPSSSGAPAGAAASDTARGRVAVVGSTPITQVVLRPAAGRSITLTGPLADEIRAASGADVWVRGRRVDERTFEVARYAVRTVDGVTAITGTLSSDGDRLVLVDDDGRRHVVANPPSALREHVGARVWISGDLATGLTAYGVLRRRR